MVTLHAGHQLHRALLAGDVVAMEGDPGRWLPGGLRQTGGVHRRALGRETRADRRADASAPAGDDRDPSREISLAHRAHAAQARR